MLLSYGNVFAQTKTKYETAVISTGHASLSAEIIKNGSALEVWVKNNHPTKTYKVNFTANIRLGGTKGEIVKTLSTSVKLTPNDDDYAIGSIGEADPSKNLYLSLIGGTFSNFDWSEVRDSNNSETSSNNASYSGSNNNTSTTNSRPPANASVQELSEWQRKQYGTQNNQQNTQPINNTASPQQTQTTNSNNGVTMADVQKILDENNRQFEQRLGIKSYANDTEMVNDIAKGVGEIVDLFRANRELDRKEEEQKRAAEESRKLEEAAAQQKVDNRKIIINKFQPKDIPVSSKEKASKIYYFIYAYDNTINNLYGSALMYVSNVFEIGKYNDGTRAYTSTVKKEMETLTPFDEVLHGYYYTQQEAEQLRQTLISILKNNGVTVNEVNYKGKPASKSAVSTTTKQENFWGETQNDQKLAPAKINTAKPSELPREEKKKNFWD